MRAARTAGITADSTVTSTPTLSAAITVRSLEDERALRNVEADLAHDGEQQRGQPDAGGEAEQRRDDPDDRGLGDHGDDHLAPAGAHRAQQAELARPLRDEDREGVEDDERADHEPDRGEAEEQLREEPEEVVNWLLRSAANSLASVTSNDGPSRCWILVASALWSTPGAAITFTASMRPGASNTRCAVARSKAANVTASGWLRFPKRKRPDDPKALLRAVEEHVDGVADLEPVLAGGADVHRHLTIRGGDARPPRGAAADSRGDPEPTRSRSSVRRRSGWSRRRGRRTARSPAGSRGRPAHRAPSAHRPSWRPRRGHGRHRRRTARVAEPPGRSLPPSRGRTTGTIARACR